MSRLLPSIPSLFINYRTPTPNSIESGEEGKTSLPETLKFRDPEFGATPGIIALDKHMVSYGRSTTIEREIFGGNRDSEYSEYAMISMRKFNQKKKLVQVKLTIQSPLLVKALREIVGDYPEPIDVGDVIKITDAGPPIPYFPALVYYYRKELKEYAYAPEQGDNLTYEIKLLLRFLEYEMGGDLVESDQFLAKSLTRFNWLWMIFRPGCIVWELSNEQLYRLQSVSYRQTQNGGVLILQCYYIDYDGKFWGQQNTNLLINYFPGARKIDTLSVFPLEFHRDIDGLKARLTVRSSRSLLLQAKQMQNHVRHGRVLIDCEGFCIHMREETLRLGRSGLDGQAFQQAIPSLEETTFRCVCEECCDPQNPAPTEHTKFPLQLDPDAMLLCSSRVCTFTFATKQWQKLFINELSDIIWANNPMDTLVTSSEVQRKIILGLVGSLQYEENNLASPIEKKGTGLIMLLHGPPGTGKTLTAELVCEHLHRPLYVVSGGELGTTAVTVDEALRKLLELAVTWKAVVLIDEADVFLEERSCNDVLRNSLVSIFLRHLEYFQGILFLTTNRVSSFDSAFTSRIHLSLHYPALDVDIRQKIWRNAILRLPAGDRDIDVENDLEDLKGFDVNGRVVTYAVRTALSIAKLDDVKLRVKHLRDVLETSEKFHEVIKQGKDSKEASLKRKE